MKRNLFAFVLCCLMFLVCPAMADGYTTGDNWNEPYTGTGGIAYAEVISKSVTLRDEPSMGGGKIVSIPSEASLTVLEEIDDSWVKAAWQKDGKTYEGYVRSEYIVINPEYITLRRSNTPAYSVPSREGKMLGSLAKMTRLRVIGTWENYYVVYLRGGSAFIRMDADVWTDTELSALRESTYQASLGGRRGKIVKKTSLRTGPGSSWPEIMTLKTGAVIDVSAWSEDGWAFVKDLDGNAGYVSLYDIQ